MASRVCSHMCLRVGTRVCAHMCVPLTIEIKLPFQDNDISL